MSELGIRHASPSEGFDHQEPRAKSIVLLAIASVILLVLVIVGVTAYFEYLYRDMVQEKVLSAPSAQLNDLRDRETQQLTKYSYIDKDSGLVRIPVDRAMELFAQEAAGGKLFYPGKPYAPKPEEPPTAAK